MKKLLFVLTLGAALALPALAQDATNNPPPPPDGGPGGHHDHMKFLTDAEKAELKKDHDAALAADPTLASEEQAIKAAHDSGTPPTDAQKQQFHDFHEQLNAEMVKLDPAIAPILAKLKAHHHGPGDHGPGAGGPPPSDPTPSAN